MDSARWDRSDQKKASMRDKIDSNRFPNIHCNEGTKGDKEDLKNFFPIFLETSHVPIEIFGFAALEDSNQKAAQL